MSVLCSVISPMLIAQSGPVGARSAGMGRCSIAISDVWSIMNNPAGIAIIRRPIIGINYEYRNMMKELSSKSAAFIFPIKQGTFGLSYNHFGYSLFNRQKIGIAYARSFGSYLSVGVQLDYLITSLGNSYGRTNNVTFEIGIQSDISEKITMGAWIYNPLHVQLTDFDNEKLSTIIRFGGIWNVSETLVVTFESEKNTEISMFILRGGVEYSIRKSYFFRTGFSTSNEIFSFGLGYNVVNLTMNLSSIYHNYLGFSPQMGLSFQF